MTDLFLTHCHIALKHKVYKNLVLVKKCMGWESMRGGKDEKGGAWEILKLLWEFISVSSEPFKTTTVIIKMFMYL